MIEEVQDYNETILMLPTLTTYPVLHFLLTTVDSKSYITKEVVHIISIISCSNKPSLLCQYECFIYLHVLEA